MDKKLANAIFTNIFVYVYLALYRLSNYLILLINFTSGRHCGFCVLLGIKVNVMIWELQMIITSHSILPQLIKHTCTRAFFFWLELHFHNFSLYNDLKNIRVETTKVNYEEKVWKMHGGR